MHVKEEIEAALLLIEAALLLIEAALLLIEAAILLIPNDKPFTEWAHNADSVFSKKLKNAYHVPSL